MITIVTSDAKDMFKGACITDLFTNYGIMIENLFYHSMIILTIFIVQHMLERRLSRITGDKKVFKDILVLTLKTIQANNFFNMAVSISYLFFQYITPNIFSIM